MRQCVCMIGEIVHMENLNVTFFEEFKRLDKICREIYGVSQGGVTNYIEDMKSVSAFESKEIPSWDSDLKFLIKMRHIRNQLSHGIDTMNLPMCGQSDILWLKDFYNRILEQSDPIALLYQRRKEKAARTKTSRSGVPTASAPNHPSVRNHAAIIFLLLFGCSLVVALIIVILLLLL